jgi:hypothetical protein
VLRVIVGAELSLGEPDVDHGLVTWFDVRVAAGEGADGAVIGEARVARIHVGEASNLNEPLYHVLDADSGELEALYDVFFGRTPRPIARSGDTAPPAPAPAPHSDEPSAR